MYLPDPVFIASVIIAVAVMAVIAAIVMIIMIHKSILRTKRTEVLTTTDGLGE